MSGKININFTKKQLGNRHFVTVISWWWFLIGTFWTPISCLFACWYKFTKSENYFYNYWVGMLENGRGLLDHEILKSGVSHKWFDALIRLTGWMIGGESSLYLWLLIYLGNILLLSYGWKGVQPIRLQDSLITYTSW